MNAARAKEMGLCWKVVPHDTLMDEARALAGRLCQSAPLAVRATKAAIRRGLGLQIREAAHAEAYAQAESLATDDAREGIAALLAKRPPEFTGR